MKFKYFDFFLIYFYRCAYSDLNHPYEFTVATTSRTYYIIAENSQERESWMSKFDERTSVLKS
jgi:hypothetical protein